MELTDDLIPRGVPKPTSFQETFNKPEVPEVSLIFDSKSPFEKTVEKKTVSPQEQPLKKTPNPAPVSESYNVWRYKNAHLLNHVSSRSNSFQPAPLYNDSSKIGKPNVGCSENGPTHNGVYSGNGETYNGNRLENRPSYTGSVENGSTYGRSYSENEPPFTTNGTENRPMYNRTESGPCYASESLQAQQNISAGFPNDKQLAYKASSPNGPPNFTSYGTYGPVPQNNSTDYRKHYPLAQSINGNYIQSANPNPSQLRQLNGSSDLMAPQDKSFSPSGKTVGMGERYPGPPENPGNHKNGYHMNYMHFSSVSAPIANCVPTNIVSNRNCAASELNGNYQGAYQCSNSSSQNHNVLSSCSRGVSNPYQNGYSSVGQNMERKVSFEEPERNTFESVLPCRCDTCLQKAYTRTRSATINSPRQHEAQLVKRIVDSPCSLNDKQKGKKISTSDLYQIVLNQTEQLTLLREKVDKLLSERMSVCHHCSCSQSSPQKRTIAVQADSDKNYVEGNLQLKSVGVNTSLHDRTLSPPSQKSPSASETRDVEKKSCACNCSRQTSPKNKSPTLENKREDNSHSKGTSPASSPFREKNDVSLTLNAANFPPVPEQVPSPEPSVHVEMQDYHSSSDDESIESVKQNSDIVHPNGKPNGWTFYDNVIGQVNNILQNSQEAATQSQPTLKNPVNAIRQATLEQLQKMGISVFDDKNSCEKRMGYEPPPCSRFNNQPNPYNGRESDLSLHMNQLAMKYLNKEQFANVGIQQDIAVCNMNGGTNLSFTTLRYLERYHLMPAELKQDLPPGRDCRAEENFNNFQPQFENNAYRTPQEITNKVLDITALKQQPKLL